MPDPNTLAVNGMGTAPITPAPSERTPALRSDKSAEGRASFSEMLSLQQGLAPSGEALSFPPMGGVRFSAHAQTRMQSRQLSLNPEHLQRLQGAVDRAAGKGSKDALVLMDDMAMVVSVKNRTVVTVVDKDNLKANVFTNIDSAVIA